MEERNVLSSSSEKIFSEELIREVKEETGILIKIPFVCPMYPAVYIDIERKTVDLAFMVPIGIVRKRPTIGECTYVTPEGLKELAERHEGERLVSGWGRRMCRMALMAFCHSPNPQYQQRAKKMLLEVQKKQS